MCIDRIIKHGQINLINNLKMSHATENAMWRFFYSRESRLYAGIDVYQLGTAGYRLDGRFFGGEQRRPEAHTVVAF